MRPRCRYVVRTYRHGTYVGACGIPIDKVVDVLPPRHSRRYTSVAEGELPALPVQPNIVSCRTSSQQGRRHLVSNGDQRVAHRIRPLNLTGPVIYLRKRNNERSGGDAAPGWT
jgi:hypothetical protein